MAIEDSLSCANTEVIEFTALVCRIPALQDHREALWKLIVVSEPVALDHHPTDRDRILLVLAHKGVFTHTAAETSQDFQVLTLGLQGLATLEQLKEMFKAPDIRPLSASDISAVTRWHDKMQHSKLTELSIRINLTILFSSAIHIIQTRPGCKASTHHHSARSCARCPSESR